MSYARDRFVHASRILTETSESLRHRLHDAFVHHVMHVDRTQVPEDCLPDFDYIHRHVTPDRGLDRDQISSRIHEMPEDLARDLASKILFISMVMIYM